MDLLHNARIYNTAVDMGVYEFGSATLGIDSNTFEMNNVIIYPNPTSSFLQIQMNGVIKYATIYSLLGTKVKEVKTNTINVSSLKSGIYLIRVTNENGQSFSKRFVKN